MRHSQYTFVKPLFVYCTPPPQQYCAGKSNNPWNRIRTWLYYKVRLYYTIKFNIAADDLAMHRPAPVLILSYRNIPFPEHDDVIKWKHFPRYWPFVRGIHRSPVNSPHKGQWRGALMIPFICVGINGWINNRDAGDMRRYCAHYDVIVMI